MKERFKYLIPIIIITTLVFPKPAFAFIGTGIFDYFNTALEGIEAFSNPVAKFIFTIFLFYVVGLGVLFLSSYLLQTVLGNLSWLSVTNNTMVLSGWSFVAGITNMFFILVFVFIALATILKIETLAAKKLLPKLLLVALLVNFSLIFVGVTIDISNIFYSTIIGGNTDFIPDIFSALTGSGESTLIILIAMVSILLILFIVPFSSPFAQLGLVVLVIATGFIGQLLIWLIQAMMFFMMSGILLVYVFLFAARIFVLQLLAMVAPIAFLCSVLPQTKKYWDDWLKMVVEWNTFGVVTLLFLVVGLRGVNALLPPEALTGITFSGATLFWGRLPGYFTYYFFLFVYLVALLYFSQKYSPQLASMLISQAKAMGGMIYTKGLKPMGGTLKSSYQDLVRKQPEAEKELERRRAKGKKARLLAFRVGAGKVLTRPAKWAARGRGTTLEREQAKEVEKAMAKLESTFGKDIASAIKVYGGKARYKGAMRAALPLYLTKMKGGEGIDKFEEMMGDKKFKKRMRQSVDAIAGDVPHMLGDFVKHRRKLIEDPEVGKLIQKTLVSKEFEKDENTGKYKDKDIQSMIDKKVTIDGENIEDLLETSDGREKIKKEAVNKKLVGALRVSDIENLSQETLGDEKFQEMVAKYRTDWNFIRKLATEKGVNLGDIQDLVKKKNIFKEVSRINPSFVRAAYSPGGSQLMKPWEYTIEGEDKPKTIDGKDNLTEELKQFKLEFEKEGGKKERRDERLRQVKKEEKSPMEKVIRRMGDKKEIPREKLIEHLPPILPVEKKEEKVKEIEEEVKERAPDWMRERAPKERVEIKERVAEELRKPIPPKKSAWAKEIRVAEWQKLWEKPPVPPLKEELEKEIGGKKIPNWVDQAITLSKESQDKINKNLESLTSLNKETSELILERDSLDKRLTEFSEDKVPSKGELEKVTNRRNEVARKIDKKLSLGGDIIERIKRRRGDLEQKAAKISSWRKEAKVPLKKEDTTRALMRDLGKIKSEIPFGKITLEQVKKHSKRIDKEINYLEKADDEIETSKQKLKSLQNRRKDIGEYDEGKKGWKGKEGTGVPLIHKRVRTLTLKINKLSSEINRKEGKRDQVNEKLKLRKEAMGKIREKTDSWKEKRKESFATPMINLEEIKQRAEEVRETIPVRMHPEAERMAKKELAREAEKLLTSSLGGALKFIPSEIKKPVKEGRRLQFKLKSGLAKLKKLEERRGRLEIRKIFKDRSLEADIPISKEEINKMSKEFETERKELRDGILKHKKELKKNVEIYKEWASKKIKLKKEPPKTPPAPPPRSPIPPGEPPTGPVPPPSTPKGGAPGTPPEIKETKPLGKPKGYPPTRTPTAFTPLPKKPYRIKKKEEEKKFFRNGKLYTRDKGGKEIEIKPGDYSLKALEEAKKARERKEEEGANLDLRKKLDDIRKGEK